MTLYERTGTRDLTFSAWHRTLRPDLHWIDVDHVAYCARCKEILYVAEICFDNGQYKTTTVTRQLAGRLAVPALLIRYRKDEDGALTEFVVQRVAPEFGDPVVVAPDVLADWFEKQHDDHVCT